LRALPSNIMIQPLRLYWHTLNSQDVLQIIQ
jgi:hypothetical protein